MFAISGTVVRSALHKSQVEGWISETTVDNTPLIIKCLQAVSLESKEKRIALFLEYKYSSQVKERTQRRYLESHLNVSGSPIFSRARVLCIRSSISQATLLLRNLKVSTDDRRRRDHW